MTLLLLIFGLIMFIGLVVVHELGHFVAAKRNGVEVEEFGIGFPPRAWARKTRGGYDFSINWLPLGGFVKLKGEHDSDTEKGSYGAARLPAKLKILTAGVLMNFITAVLLFTVLALTGMPKAQLESLPFYNREQFTVKSDTKIVQNKVYVAVVPGSPAAEAGIEDGDQLTRIGDREIANAEDLPAITESFRGQTVNVDLLRSGKNLSFEAKLNAERKEKVGHLGVAPVNSQTFRSTWSAPIVGTATALQYTEVSLKGLGYVFKNLFAGRGSVASEAVGGPVATFKILSDTAALGLGQVMFVIALISISLAVMNILPIPALDGGRAFVTLLFRAIKKPLTEKAEDWIHGTGFLLLLILIALITVVDIRRFF